ncbi:hypothetical protein BDF21DRAFT_409008 [Thamnidium elegans]|nr:hypothetical protein BDF21DRAFT_409008 [Thamnidium elegans]
MNAYSTKLKLTTTIDVNRNNNTIPLKRTRAKRSCDFCRKRKARCDADHTIPCSNCKAVKYYILVIYKIKKIKILTNF